MSNYSTNIYQILKAIDLSYENQDFNAETTLDLEKLEISQHRLDLILENLSNDGYLTGITVVKFIGGSGIKFNNPKLTTQGILFLENNSNMKKAYSTLKEMRGWIPGFS